MVWSNNMVFEVAFINPKSTDKLNNMFKEITTPDGLYVIASAGDEFQISLVSDDRNATYAAVVIIDGYKMPQNKTFRRQGKVMGFKHTPGTYRAFKFQRPGAAEFGQTKFKRPNFNQQKYLEVDTSHENDTTDYEGGPGEIVVKIYRTIAAPRKPRAEGGGGGAGGGTRTPKEHNDPEFQPFAFNDDKSGLDQALGVGFGEIYQSQSGGGGGGGSRFGGSQFGEAMSHKPDISEEGIVASFRFFYTDIYSLITKRFVNLDFPQHLTLVPSNYFESNKEGLIQALQTIVRGGRAVPTTGVPMEEVLQRCQFWLKFPLSQVLYKAPPTENDGFIVDDSFQPTDEELLRKFFAENEKYFVEDKSLNVLKVGEHFSKQMHRYQDIEEGEL